MENKIIGISKRLIKEIEKQRDLLLEMNPEDKYEATVILNYIRELDKQESLLEIVIEESQNDIEYIMENQNDIKKFFKFVKEYCSNVPKYE